ncbi:hypothetical protein C8A01DRAFT_42939 [Parachaetomium inaequale]|uniref:Uncharacterized protein n=1 Tax=Parachaetomium inaequale TaxID=2588326 RepID=A0AAN6SVZ1_9PEZI|nr:hypothetical protein C8A01DRAFT_42939 [Parachaetomium inaequale]
MAPLKPALLLHLLIETPASLSFLLAPYKQLPGASPEAKLILRNFGGLLLSTNLVCLALLFRKPVDNQLMAMLCACLGTYHVWPIYRAWARMGAHDVGGKVGEKVLGGPVVHFVVHVVCLGALLGSGVVGLLEG